MLRNMNRIRAAVCVFLAVFILTGTALPVLAAGSWPSYTYNTDGEAVPTAMPYETEQILSGESLGVGAFKGPQDLYVSDDGEVYILDSGNSRIVVLDSQLKLNRIIEPMTQDAEPLQFREAQGLSVCDDGRLIICDKKAHAVYILDPAGKQIGIVEKPESSLIPDSFQFQPIRAEEDSGGILYVLSSGSFSGALQFESDGSFLGFYGSEEVDITLKVMLNYFWKNILSSKAAEGLSRTVPVEFVSFCIDRKDFVFTIRKGNEVKNGQVRKLNAKGENVLDPEKSFGDSIDDIQLVDLAVDDGGFITVIDGGTGRILQYDADGQILYAFATKSTQTDGFSGPVAVETLGQKLLVLDEDRGFVTVFCPTQFAANVRKATELYRDGEYELAKEPWLAVLASDNHYELANIGMGKIYEGLGDYPTAMEYYRKGNDKANYSDAFEQYRGKLIRENFALFLGIIVILIAVAMYFLSRRPRFKEVYAGGRPKGKYPMYCMMHPINGYFDLKSEKSGSVWRANVILGLFFAIFVMSHQLTGFAYNGNQADKLNLWACLCSSVGVFAAFVTCNWAVTTIMDGKGKFSEIWTFCAYALVPYILTGAVTIVLSNVLTADESAFYQAAMIIGYAWTALGLVICLREVHQYSLWKTIWTSILTFIGLMIVVVIAAIIYSVFSQLFGFVATIWSEISMYL